MGHKIVLVEGIPGLGKSAIAQEITLQLKKNNIHAIWFHEMDSNNPVGRPFKMNKNILRQSMRKWKRFIKNRDLNTTYIFDGRLLFLNIMKYLEYNQNYKLLKKQLSKLSKLFSDTETILVSLISSNIDVTLKRSNEDRDIEDFLVNELKESKYGRRNNLVSYKDLVSCYEDMNKLILDFTQSTKIDSSIYDVNKEKYEKISQNICKLLRIDYFKPDRFDIEKWNNYAGSYNKIDKFYFKIEYSERMNCFLIKDHPISKYPGSDKELKLIYIGNNTFLGRSSPFKYLFTLENDGYTIHEMKWMEDKQSLKLKKSI